VRRAARLLALLGLAGCAVGRAPAPPGRLPAPLLTPFGGRHAGIDLRAPVGTPVLAAADGVVLVAGERPRAGRLVVLAHADDLGTVYMHLSAVTVRVGQAVRRGEAIGRAGRSGNATTPHLHFGVCRRPGGRCGTAVAAGWADPAAWWMAPDPCFAAGRSYAATPLRLTFPLPCAGVAGGRPAGGGRNTPPTS